MMLRLILILMVLASPAVALEEVTLPSGRSYLIALPPGVAHPPMVLALHGGGGNPNQLARSSRLTEPALKAGFAVIYPAGSSRRGPLLTWNAGRCCAYAAAARIDDIGFLDQVIADAARRFGADASRVGLTGMSNGAMMALAYAAERPGKVSAVVSVSGTLDLRRYPPKGPVPVMHIHGTADRNVPYRGGVGDLAVNPLNYVPVETMMQAWVRAARRALAKSQRVIDPADDGMRVVETRWTDRSGRPFLRLMTVEGGGHDWPGSARANRRGATRDIDASAEAVGFFRLWLN